MANRYWVGDGGAIAGTTHWSDTDGGSNGFSEPTSADDVFFTSNSFSSTGQTVTGNLTCKSLTCTDVTNSPTFTFGIYAYGNITFASGITITSGYSVNVYESCTLVSAGCFIYNIAFQTKVGGYTFNFGDDINTGTGQSGVQINGSGWYTVNTNGYTINSMSWGNSSTNYPTLNLGSSIIYVSGGAVGWDPKPATLNAGTSKIVMNGYDLSGAQNFVGNGKAYYEVEINGRYVVVTGSNTYNSFTINPTVYPDNYVKLQDTQTMTTLSIDGDDSALRCLWKNAGTNWKVVPSNNCDMSYVDITDMYNDSTKVITADINSVNAGNNTGITFTDPTSVASEDVVLLMHMDGANGDTVFTDSSLYANTINVNGSVQISTSQSVFGGASAYFPGGGSSYLDTPNSVYAFGTGDWTLDFRIRLTDIASKTINYGDSIIGNSEWILCATKSSSSAYSLYFIYKSGPTYDIALNISGISDNTWYHVTLMRAKSRLFIWVNEAYDRGTEIRNASTTGDKFYIGKSYTGFSAYLVTGYVDFKGYIDELRLVKSAVYDLDCFTPPTSAYTAETEDVLLLHFDGTDGSTTFIDSSNSAKTITVGGSAVLKTSVGAVTPKIGTAMGYWNGSDAYLSVPDSTDWVPNSTDDYTFIDTYYYQNGASPSGLGQGTIMGQNIGTNPSELCNATGLMQIGPGINLNIGFGTIDPSNYKRWVHLVIQRRKYKNVVYYEVYVDGTLINRRNITTTVTDKPNPLIIGKYSASLRWSGFFDEMRRTKGKARYRPRFYPMPTEVFPDPEPPGFNIYLGDKQVTKIYLGDVEITQAYLGNKTLK
jgi:hypothetical protein